MGSEERDREAGRSPVPARVLAPVVLVVDDEVVVRGLLQEFLVLEGYRVLCAGDGAEALEIYRRHAATIDAVILDLLTPFLDGCDVFEAMRRIDPGMPIVMTSDVPLDDRAAALARRDGARFVQKPFGLNEVLIGLEDVLDPTRARDPRGRAA